MYKRPLVTALVLASLVPLTAGAGPMVSQASPRSDQTQVDSEAAGALIIAGRPVMQVAAVSTFTGADRALEVMRRVIRVLEPEDPQQTGMEPFDVNRDVRAGMQGNAHVVIFKGLTVVTVTGPDARAVGLPAPQVAQMWANNLKAGLEALGDSAPADIRQALHQIQVAVGGQTIANGVTGASDAQIAERIRRRIARDPQLQGTEVTIDVRGDEVILRGTVPSGEIQERIEAVVGDEAAERRIRSDMRIQGEQPSPE